MSVADDALVLNSVRSRDQIILSLVIRDFNLRQRIFLLDLESTLGGFLGLHVDVRNGRKRKKRLERLGAFRCRLEVVLLHWVLQVDASDSTIFTEHLSDFFLRNRT